MNKPIKPNFLAVQAQQLQMLSLEQTKVKTALSKTLIYKLVAAGAFPAPVPLTKSGSRVGWLESEVDNYILQCASNRVRRAA